MTQTLIRVFAGVFAGQCCNRHNSGSSRSASARHPCQSERYSTAEDQGNLGPCQQGFCKSCKEKPFTSSNLVATKTTFCEATFCGLLATVGHISTLQLQFVDAHNLERMIIVACCCTSLQSLTVHVKPRESHISLGEDELKLCTCVWRVLHSKELSMMRETQSALSCAVVSGKRTLLEFEKLTTMPLLDHKRSLATTTAGSLHALHMLALAFAQDLQDLLLSNPPRVSDLDAAMLNLMPALKSIDIHNQPFFASFSGIMQGQLSRRTANTLYQAEVVHCMGLAEAVRSVSLCCQ